MVTDDEDDDQEMVYSHHITDYIRSWSQPPLLVFLNGCNNASQVRAFHSANVAVVIATHRAINVTVFWSNGTGHFDKR